MAFAATLGYVALALGRRHWQSPGQRALMTLTWLLHAAVLLLGFAGEPPRFGFGPALSVTAWLVLTVYAIETWIYPRLQSTLTLILASLGAVAVPLAWLFPGSDQLNLPSQWLPVHWALGVASYAMFATAVLHAWLMQRTELAIRAGSDASAGLPLLALERLTFRFVAAGFVLLSATLAAGGWFAHALTGGWVWNHKTVFSVLGWLITAVLLWGRWQLGWRGRTAVRVLYAGTGLLLLGYVGSRFVLEVLLQRA